ncbi:MAG TPA: toxin-antitoxin system HicB family antitoxin [Bryobacteraceae bacterium]|nr:toxin-antitoxin system HicB family antitoxin [Bryobacteraceae bacterium]
MAQRKAFLLRLDPAVHEALERWAAEELRSLNGQIEYLLRRALQEAGRMPRHRGGSSQGGQASGQRGEESPRQRR